MTNRLKTFFFCAAGALLSFGLLAADSAGKPEPAKPGAGKSYQVRSKKHGELLRPEEANSADGTPIVLYPAQHWKCMTWKFDAAGDSTFSLQNHYTSKTFAPKPAGRAEDAAVTQVPFAKKAGERPAWQFSKLSDGTYKITEVKSGKALTGVKAGQGVKIIVRTWGDSEDQRWELLEIDPKTLTM